MSDLGPVVVLAGGLSYEREVSLASGARLTEALLDVGVEAVQWDWDDGLLPKLASGRPAAIFPTLHGAAGEDGSVQQVFDLLDLPYVGSGPAGCRVAFDKPSAKAAVRAAGLRTPDWVALPQTVFRELGADAVLGHIVDRLGVPLMVKPARGGSALGTSVVDRAEQLPMAMVGCFSYDELALVETYERGIEVAVTVLDLGDGPFALPAVEIVPSTGRFDYAARYTAGMTEYHVPARLPTETATAVGEAAVRAHRCLGLRDLSRADFILNDDVCFLETNVAPGLTHTSLFPIAAAAAGFELGALARELLHQATARGPQPSDH